MEWYIKALKNYVGFEGRARRREYWYFTLCNVLVALALAVIDSLMDSSLLTALYSLAVLLPGLAVTVRRLHDTGRTGWWLLVGLVPLVGGIVLLVFVLLDSEPGTNRYGQSPKQVAVAVPPPAVV